MSTQVLQTYGVIVIALYAVSCFGMDPQQGRFFAGPFVRADEDLFDALSIASPDSVRRALAADANANRAQPDGNTPLHILASGLIGLLGSRRREIPHTSRYAGGVVIVQALLEHNANPLAPNGRGLTPLQILDLRLAAVSGQSRPFLEQMRDLIQKAVQQHLNKQLVDAIKEGQADVVERLLGTEGIQPNDATRHGTPILFLAALYSRPAIAERMVRMLIPALADLNPVNSREHRLIDVLRGFQDRQSVIDLIEEAVRGRPVLTASPRPSRWGVVARFFGRNST